jgi:hypothetical protein
VQYPVGDRFGQQQAGVVVGKAHVAASPAGTGQEPSRRSVRGCAAGAAARPAIEPA